MVKLREILLKVPKNHTSVIIELYTQDAETFSLIEKANNLIKLLNDKILDSEILEIMEDNGKIKFSVEEK